MLTTVYSFNVLIRTHTGNKIMKAVILFALAMVPGMSHAVEPDAVTRQLVTPVLIRNEHNTLLQLTINAEQPFLQVHSIRVALEGAGDLQSLQFYFTGGETGFSSEKPFGERMRPETTIVFSGSDALFPFCYASSMQSQPLSEDRVAGRIRNNNVRRFRQ